MGTCSEKYPSLEKIRTQTNSRTQIHSILEQFTDDTLNLSQDQKEKVVYSRVGSTVKKKEQMLQIQ